MEVDAAAAVEDSTSSTDGVAHDGVGEQILPQAAVQVAAEDDGAAEVPETREKDGPRPQEEKGALPALTMKKSEAVKATGEGKGEKSKRRKKVRDNSNLPLNVCPEPDCNYSTTTLGNYTRHRRIHTNIRLMTCDMEGCSYRCDFKSELRKHMETHGSKALIACADPTCTFTCIDKKAMKVHMREHIDEKPYACTFAEECTFRTANKSNLKAHMRRHLGIKICACPELGCDFSSYKKEKLVLHRAEAHPESYNQELFLGAKIKRKVAIVKSLSSFPPLSLFLFLP